MNYAQNQVWVIKNTQDSGCKFARIIKIDNFNIGEVIHIAVLDKNYNEIIEHMPFAKEAFSKSVKSLIHPKLSAIQNFDGYTYWTKEFENGEAGVYGVSIIEAISL